MIDSLFLTITVLAVAAALETTGLPRVFASALLVFVLPGRAILAAWFPHRLADAPGSFLLVGLMSIAATATGGLLLNLLPQGLQPQTWALWLGGITIFNGAVALLLSIRERAPSSGWQGLAIHPGQVLTILLAGVIVAGALLVARGGALDQPRPGFTQFWMVPGETPASVQIGVKNEEGEAVPYRLVVLQGKTTIQTSYEELLGSGASWTAIISLPADAGTTSQPIEAQLYRIDKPDSVYRNVTLWVSEANSK